MPLNPNCVPNTPYAGDKQLDEIFEAPKIPFSPDDMDGPPPYNDYNEMEDILRDAERGVDTTALRKNRGALQRWWRPIREWSKDAQMDTGVPIWNWVTLIEDGRDAIDKVMSRPLQVMAVAYKKMNKESRRHVQLLMEAEGEAYETLAGQFSPRAVATAQLIKQEYYNFAGQYGYGKEWVDDLFKNVIPKIRERQGDYVMYERYRTTLPEPYRLLRDQIRTRDLDFSRELDAMVIQRRVFQGIANEQHLMPAWKFVKAQHNVWTGDEAPGIYRDLHDIFERYLQEVRHQPDTAAMSLNTAWRHGLEWIAKQPGFRSGKLNTWLKESESVDIPAALLNANFMANISWNVGVAARNLLQLTLVGTRIGLRDSVYGMKKAMAASMDKKAMDVYERMGVITRDVTGSGVYEIGKTLEALGGRSAFGDKAGAVIDWYKRTGAKPFRMSEVYNRIAAYEGMKQHSMKYAKQYAEGKIDWKTMIEKSMWDTMDRENGPALKLMKSLLDDGQVDEAVHKISMMFQSQTQFTYTRGNVPYAMQGTAGRMFGQYGNWPAWYGEHLRTIAMRGSTKNKLKQAGRFLAINYGVYKGMEKVFGADMGKWTFFSPLSYTGGPLFQMGVEGVQYAASKLRPGEEQDPVQRMENERFLENSLKQITPIPWAGGRGARAAYEKMMQEDYAGAIRRILGLPDMPEAGPGAPAAPAAPQAPKAPGS